LGSPLSPGHLLVFEPGGYGGDHAHERQELMLATNGNPILLHRNAENKIVRTPMGPDEEGNLSAFFVPSWTPHAVINPSDQPTTLYEIRDRVSADFTSFDSTPESMLPADFREFR